MILLSLAITFLSPDSFYSVYTCRHLDTMYTSYNSSTDALLEKYPACGMIENEKLMVIVPAQFSERREEVGSVLGITFGVAVWIAIVLHVLGTELYLSKTEDEDQRLRKASEIRRSVRGVKT